MQQRVGSYPVTVLKPCGVNWTRVVLHSLVNVGSDKEIQLEFAGWFVWKAYLWKAGRLGRQSSCRLYSLLWKLGFPYFGNLVFPHFVMVLCTRYLTLCYSFMNKIHDAICYSFMYKIHDALCYSFILCTRYEGRSNINRPQLSVFHWNIILQNKKISLFYIVSTFLYAFLPADWQFFYSCIVEWSRARL